MKQDIRIDFSPEAVLIGNGDFPTHSLPLQLLNASPFTVCCDGAANHYLDSGRIPDRIVGDGIPSVKNTSENMPRSST